MASQANGASASSPVSRDERPSIHWSSWRLRPTPGRWKAYSILLALLSAPLFVRGLLALPAAPVGWRFLLALLVMLAAARRCILELPPHRFLHLVSGMILFGGFFIMGPAVLGALFVVILLSEMLIRLVSRLRAVRPGPRLGDAPAEYVTPTAAIAIVLGSIDALRRPIGLSYPYRVADASLDARLVLTLMAIYAAFVVLTEFGIYLRFGWQQAFATKHSRRDLVVYLLALLLGAPVVLSMVRVYGPDFAGALFTLSWMLWGFGAFAVAQILLSRQLEIERLVTAIARQERLATLGRLASVIAHQTRHHLGVLNMSSYMLDQTLAKERLSGSAREAVAHELEAIARTRTELDRLLAQELRGGTHQESFGLMALARECGTDLALMAAAGAVAFSYLGGERQVRGDRLRLRQAITNLMRNAIEASPRAGNVAVELATDNYNVSLSVRDEGPGLSPAARSHLFEPLFTEKADGLGMGLYVAREIVEAHGGKLDLLDTDGGTLAMIRLGGEP